MRNRYFLVTDVIGLLLSVFVAYTLRFDGLSWLGTDQRDIAVWFSVFAVPARVALFYAIGLYRRFWSLASVAELELLALGALAAQLLTILLGAFALPALELLAARVPISVLLIDGLLVSLTLALPRLSVRFWERQRVLRHGRRLHATRRGAPTLIVGAGSSAQSVARELLSQPGAAYRPVGFIDDEIGGRRGKLGDLPVLGRIDDLPSAARATGARHLIIARPMASGEEVRGILRRARELGLVPTVAPSILNVESGRARGPLLRSLRIEDLLGREPVVRDLPVVRSRLRGHTIMITGAGGSIGSELCRQIASAEPERLLLVGRGENSIFEIQQELQANFPQVPTDAIIMDVRDRPRLLEVMQRAKPHAIFHAAAHKHVPLMEANIREAVSNNVAGTQSVLDAARDAGVRHFVLISTDKAVRPTSVMGATKRLAEQLVQHAATESGYPYLSVRFGNVLGSRGSVVPTFLRQIEAGGPVLVTHPEMRRYFMTIPEAVQLVLGAYAIGEGGEVFCLDMGAPVSILTLAKDLIALTVEDPDRTIEIRFTGIRPGEKLTEELFFNHETAAPTEHPKILRARISDLDAQDVARIHALLRAADSTEGDPVLRALLGELFERLATPDGQAREWDEAIDKGDTEPLVPGALAS